MLEKSLKKLKQDGKKSKRKNNIRNKIETIFEDIDFDDSDTSKYAELAYGSKIKF